MKPHRIALVAALAIGARVATVAATLLPRLWNMKAEYVTAAVICRTEDDVAESHGQWPRSWADLGEDMSAYTTINFSLDPEKASAADVAASIKPLSGRSLTYPHAERDLERLKSVLRKAKAAKLEPPDAMDSR